jgi:glutamyl-tRNA synthetase
MNRQVRVRYAPSPTGEPHVGNIRTALFSWLYAKNTGGVFIVRIEDTDVARKVEGALEAILESLRWLSLDWDEGPEVGGQFGPYIQSERLLLYKAAAEELLSKGHAYYCYCSPDRLRQMREEQLRLRISLGYDGRCRELLAEEITDRERDRTPRVIRFKYPQEGSTSFTDMIKGPVIFSNETIDDFVLLKSDGYPTYHLASVVDDHLMEITHVMRAEEWLSSTPRHIQIYNSLGYDIPRFAHMPIILGPDRSKLSKRHGSVSVLQYKESGFLPEAMFNFLALLGWSLDDHTEIIGKNELIENFSIERIGKSGAIFSQEKLVWMNGVYIRELPTYVLTDHLVKRLEASLPMSVSRPISFDYVESITPLIRERLKTLSDAPKMVEFFFLEDIQFVAQDLVQKDMDMSRTMKCLEASLGCVMQIMDWSSNVIEAELRGLAEELNVKPGQLFGTVRVALTGSKIAPPLFESMGVLGKDACMTRLKGALMASEVDLKHGEA